MAQYTPSDCPSSLGSNPRAGTDIPIRKYYCSEEGWGYTCSITVSTTVVHRSYLHPSQLGACTTDFCDAKSYQFWLTSPFTGAWNESTCTSYTSRGEGSSHVASKEAKPYCAKSHILADTLSLEEQIVLQGVPFYLNYSSDRYKVGSPVSSMPLGLGGWWASIIHHYDIAGGILYYGYGGQRIADKVPTLSYLGTFFIPDENGTQLFYFDTWGRHFKTVDALTGVTLYQFTYDPITRNLKEIKDRFLKSTLFVYSANKVTVTSPRGEITEINIDSAGMASSVVNRNSETYQMTYNTQGQLLTFQKPGGQTSTMTYDVHGNIIKDLGAGGDFLNFVRGLSATVNNQSTTMTTARGITTQLTTTGTSTQVDRSETLSFGEVISSISVKGGLYSSISSLGPQFSATRVSDPRYPTNALHYEQDIRYQGGSP